MHLIKKIIIVLCCVVILSPATAFANSGTEKETAPPAITSINKSGEGASSTVQGAQKQNLPERVREKIEGRDRNDCVGDASGKTDCASMRAERKGEAKSRQEEKRTAVLQKIAEKIIARYDAAIERLSKIAERIDSRIAKLKSKGGNTTASEGYISLARTKLKNAQQEISSAKELMSGFSAASTASSSETGGLGKQVRAFLEEARTSIIAAHKALVDTIISLKMIHLDAATASSTGETATTTQL